MAPKHCLCHSKLGDCQDISRHINEREESFLDNMNVANTRMVLSL